MLHKQALFLVNFICSGYSGQGFTTYKEPVAKIAVTPHLRSYDICNLQTQAIGRNSKIRSEPALMTLVVTLTALEFT